MRYVQKLGVYGYLNTITTSPVLSTEIRNNSIKENEKRYTALLLDLLKEYPHLNRTGSSGHGKKVP